MKASTSLVCLILILAGCSTPPSPVQIISEPLTGIGTLAGRVVDSSGVPLLGVTVELAGAGQQVTDSDGRYAFHNIPAGEHFVSFQLAGFSALTRTIRVRPGPQNLDATLIQGVVAETITVAAESSRSIFGSVTAAVAGLRLRAAPGTESYEPIIENKVMSVREKPLSTFSIDVDRASYSNVRRFLRANQLPPVDAVRIEELINYFPYSDPAPAGHDPVAITTEVADCPWNREHRLFRIGIRGQAIKDWDTKPNNLVFLIDVSGSMDSPDKLPLVKAALRLLVEQLRGQDSVSLVVYAGAAGMILLPTAGSQREVILDAIERLDAGGSTAGGEGILLAYKTARDHFLNDGNNRVILATDGDFNVGVSSMPELENLITVQRNSGVYLTVIGFGTDNLQDSKMELLADKGNGNYAYVDSLLEAKKVFVEELGATLVTIANDVKLQIEFNPSRVESYRLIGYETRLLADEEFSDDTRDAGELGSGHFVTALYELVMAPSPTGPVGTVHLRFKRPGRMRSEPKSVKISDDGRSFESASEDLRFASAVAEWGMILRSSEHRGNATLDEVLSIARSARGSDLQGYRGDFIELVEITNQLMAVREAAVVPNNNLPGGPPD